MALRAPASLSASSKRLWRRITDDYELAGEPHALELLRMALEQVDRAEEARQTVAREGAYFSDRFGQPKAHPAIAVERDAKTLAARLLRELGLAPEEADDQRPPRTSLRAVP